jgi:alpha-beta hydrolase superfamily lysophospholipase
MVDLTAIHSQIGFALGMNSSPPLMNPPKSRKRRRILGLLIVTVLASVSLWVAVNHLAPHAIIHPLRTGVGVVPPKGIAAKDFLLPDGVTLRSWIVRPESAPSAVVFVLHGIADSKASQAGLIRFLADRGIVGIALDLRAHGDSGGEFATYGFREKDDFVHLLKSVEAEFPGLPVGIWGTSYGGAVALQSLGHEPGFDFAIVESTFANLPDMARQQVVNLTGLPLRWLAPMALRRAGLLAGFDPASISPERAMESITVPVLHLHGDHDEVIPFENGLRISRHARQPGYRFVPIPGGTHFHIRDGDPAAYSREVDDFLNRVVSGER